MRGSSRLIAEADSPEPACILFRLRSFAVPTGMRVNPAEENWMKDRMRNGVVAWAVLLAFGACVAGAQTTVAGSVTGTFRSKTSRGPVSSSTVESPSNVAGMLLELRHISNPLMGYEVSYSYHHTDEAYEYSEPTPPCPAPGSGPPCGPTTMTATVPANQSEITGDWVLSMRMPHLRPFLLVGGGVLVDAPGPGTVTATTTIITCGTVNPVCGPTTSTSQIATRTVTKGVFQYGVGADMKVLPRIGVRFQFRGNLFRAPDLTKAFTPTGKFTQEVEPMVGVTFRF